MNLPLGMPVALDASTRVQSDGSVVGGSPSRTFKLNARARKAFAELAAGVVISEDAAALGRRLGDAGALHPVPEPVAASDVTVVIPVRDRADELAACLNQFSARTIVVDDGSLDPSSVAAVAAKFGATLVQRKVNGGPAAARNTGRQHVTTEFVAFLDSDCLPPADWIDRLMGHFEDPLVVAVAPRIVAGGPAPRTYAERFSQARPVLDLGDRPARVQPMTVVSYVPTAALLMRTGAADFDESLRYGEDVDLIWRLLDEGHRVRYDPRVEVGHVEPTTWRALLKRRYAYGTSAGRLETRHPGRVAPLVLIAAPATVTAGLLLRRPWLVLTGFGVGYAEIALAYRRAGVSGGPVAKPLATGVLETFVGSGRWVAQFALPVAAAVALKPPRDHAKMHGWRRAPLHDHGGWGVRLCMITWVLAAPVRDWLRKRPPVNIFEWVGGVLVDDAAYGAGVWAGSLNEKHLRAVLPQFKARLVQKSKGPSVPPSPGGRNRPAAVRPRASG